MANSIDKHKLESNSVWFNPWWQEDDWDARNVIERLLMASVEKYSGSNNLRYKDTDLFTDYGDQVFYTLICVLASIRESILKTKYGLVKIQRDNPVYDIRYYVPREVTRYTVCLVLDALIASGYINQQVGIKGHTRNFPTLIEPTPKMKKFFINHNITLDKFIVSMDEPSVYLKDKKKNLKAFAHTIETRNTERILRIFRAQANRHKFGVNGATKREIATYVNRADFKNVRMKRIFNGSLDKGGRLYKGFWTNWPENLRHKITINGQNVIEKDYANLHIAMVYALEGYVPPSGDLYDLGAVPKIPEYQRDKNRTKHWRKLIKATTNAMLNLDKPNGLYNVLYEMVNGVYYKTTKTRGKSTLTLPAGFTLTRRGVQALRNAICVKHAPIAHRFCSGKELGAELQYRDSKIALKLIKHFQSVGILCLPEHDSFIVPAFYEQELVNKMRLFFRQETGANFDIEIN